MNRSDERFLSRWSRLKREGDRKVPERAVPDDARGAGKGQAGAGGGSRDVDAADGTGNARERVARRHDEARLEDLKSVDIDALNFDSDFERFMQKGVPDELRNKALRKLWTSNPIFGHIDGLDDYCEDFSDAAWVSPDFKTSYEVGRGFLSEEELLAGDAADKPQRPDVVKTRQASATVASTAGEHSDVAGAEVAPSDPASELAVNDHGAQEDSTAPDEFDKRT